MKTLSVKWTGIRPLVMHNGLMADPTNPFVRKGKEIRSKGTKKMTEADYEEQNRLEWMGSLYWSDNLKGPIIPSDNIERCIQMGAQKSRIGKDVQAAVFCAESIIPLECETPKTKDKMYADPKFTLRVGVVINQSRVIKVRPMIPTGWALKFSVDYEESIVNAKDLIKAMQDAGALVGLGDWRPKFGRFAVEVFNF